MSADGLSNGGADRDAARFRVESFEYTVGDLLVRLSIRLAFEVPSTTSARLLVVSDGAGYALSPLLANCRPAARPVTDEWLWHAAFSAPEDVICDPHAQFTAELPDDIVLRLPQPSVPDAVGVPARAQGHGWSRAIRRGSLLFIVTCQLSLLPAWLTGAFADTPARSATTTVTTTITTTPETAQETAPPQTPPQAPTQPERPQSSVTAAATPASAAAPAETPPAPSTTQTSAATHGGAPQTEVVSVAQEIASEPASARRPSSVARRPRAQQRHSAAAAPKPAPTPVSSTGTAAALSAVGVAEEVPPILMELQSGLTALGEIDPPAFLIPIYQQAGRRYDVPWRVLAAINQVETNYGHDLSVSSAGAVGWMQFMPETWREWAVDADHDGALNPYSPWDAIFTAARYLAANGAATDLPAAIFAYNHASWYVTEVLVRAHMLASDEAFAPLQKGYSLPLDARYMRQLGRTDDGVDIETAPDGALVYSITPGIVSTVASDPGGFGPDYPVIEATSGSLAGQYIYYGHVAASLVRPGQKVAAGQPIAIIGHAGDAASLGHGHIEIGFSNASGDPLNHHGSAAATPAGDVMRSVLVSLSAEFGIQTE